MTDTTIGYPRSMRNGDAQSDARRVAATLELVDTLKSEFQARDDLYEKIDSIIFGTHDYRIPKGYQGLGTPRHNPLAVYFCNTITAALTVDPPQVQFPQTGTTETAQANATLREHFFDASWERQEEEAEAPLFRRFTHSVVCRGEGVLKTLPRARTAWSDYTSFSKELTRRLSEGDLKGLDHDSKDRVYDAKTEEYKKTVAPYPIRSTDVDPLTFYYWKGEDGLVLAVEHKEVPYLETLVRYGMALDRSGRVVPQGMGQALPASEWRSAMSGIATLTMSEAWRWNACDYILSGPGQFSSSSGDRGQLARSFKHRYGDPVTKSLRGPYAHCLGTTTASRLPERAGLGVLYGFLDLFTMLDELLTVQQINAVITGLASFKRNRPPNQGLGESEYGEDGRLSSRQPVTIQPGYIFPDDVGPIEMPRAGEALPATIAQVKEFIDLILPKVLQGVVDTTDSGYQLALAARLGRVAFDPMVSNIRRAAARRVGFESWCIEHEIGETVYAVGTPVTKPGERSAPRGTVLAIGPDDLNGIHRYKVFLQPEDKASELVEVRKHAEMVQAGFESRSMAIEKLGGNWEEVELARTVERVMEKPQIQAQLDQRILQKIGQAQQEHVQQGDQALAAATAGMQPPPPEPGAALQGAGQVYEGGQTLPFAPPGPGVPAISSNPPIPPGPPGGLPASIPGQPPGMPAAMMANLVPPGAGPPLGV